MKIIENDFEIGEEVYLKTDPDQNFRIVTGFLIRKNGITYELSCGIENTWHYDYEINKNKTY
tara:strand:+ start:274 stop:459 length:186 start_codon:yes stop_codon:yes gene_type:complete